MPADTTPPAPPSLESLLAGKPHAIFVDFDGTLVDLAPTPGSIAVPDGLGPKLCNLKERLEGRLAIVTGRALDDLERHLGPCPLARAGSHGASRIAADGARLGDPPRELPVAVVDAMQDYAGNNCLLYEAKAHGAALHFRDDPVKEDAAEIFARQLARQHDLAVKQGKCVIELVQHGATKAGAVDAFMQIYPFAGAVPIFIGDDVTDEDGFAAAHEHGGFGIAVGNRASQCARHHLGTVGDVHRWLGL